MTYTTKDVDFAIEVNEYGQPYVNPYFGCTAGCPFCYWLSVPGWEGKVDIRLNIADQLDRYCREREAERPRLYMGSYCDPYMEEAEAEYRLTRRCLEVAAGRRFPLTLCTSARSELILRDLDLLRRIPGLTVVAELCRLDQMERLNRGEDHVGVRVANRLSAAGLRVAATFAPVLPGLADPAAVRERLAADIPLYIDVMHVREGSVQQRRILERVQALRPDLLDAYRAYFAGRRPEMDKEVLDMAGKENIRLFPIIEE